MEDAAFKIPLTEREREVLRAVAQGKTNPQIAGELRVSVATVKFHVGRLCKKLGQPNRTSLTAHAIRQGLLDGAGDEKQ